MQPNVFQYPTRDSFACDDNRVHVWRINLEQATLQVDAIERLLSMDERERAGRFYKDTDRRQFMVARGSLRMLLARYLNLPPRQLCFSYGAHGKPALAGALQNRLGFNLSHCGNLALLAVAYKGEVGIDIEALRTDVDVEAIAKQYFTPQQHQEIRAATGEMGHRLFYRYWTLKEAYLKALGLGFSGLLDEPGMLSEANQVLLRCEVDGKSPGNSPWQSHPLVLPGYAAALVTQGWDKEIYCWQLPEVI